MNVPWQDEPGQDEPGKDEPGKDEPGKDELGSPMNPIVVGSIEAEYAWIAIHCPGFKLVQQALTMRPDGRQFDVMTLENDEGEEKVIWFDISSFFGKKSLAERLKTGWDLDRIALVLIVVGVIYFLFISN